MLRTDGGANSLCLWNREKRIERVQFSDFFLCKRSNEKGNLLDQHFLQIVGQLRICRIFCRSRNFEQMFFKTCKPAHVPGFWCSGNCTVTQRLHNGIHKVGRCGYCRCSGNAVLANVVHCIHFINSGKMILAVFFFPFIPNFHQWEPFPVANQKFSWFYWSLGKFQPIREI